MKLNHSSQPVKEPLAYSSLISSKLVGITKDNLNYENNECKVLWQD